MEEDARIGIACLSEWQAEVCLTLSYITQDQYETFEKKRGEVGYLLYRYMISIHS